MNAAQYYADNLHAIQQPTHMHQREFGYQDCDGKFVRHLQFSSMQKLLALVKLKLPFGLYCSNSRYQNPSAYPMDAKGWISAELVFDLDGPNMLELPIEHLQLLVEKLKLDLGIQQANIAAYYSGNKGFHIHVGESKYDKIGSNARRAIARYLVLAGVSTLDVQVTADIHRILRMPGSLNSKAGNAKSLYSNFQSNPK